MFYNLIKGLNNTSHKTIDQKLTETNICKSSVQYLKRTSRSLFYTFIFDDCSIMR